MNKEVARQEKRLRTYILNNLNSEFINSLKKINHWRTLFTFIHIWATILISFLLINHIINLYGITASIWLLPIAIFIATRQNALAVQIHEAAHYHLFDNRNLNDIFCNIFASYWILNDVESYRINHFRHHRYLHSDNDPDKELYSIKNKKSKDKINLLVFLEDITLITAIKRILVYKDKKNINIKNKSTSIHHDILKVSSQFIVFFFCYIMQNNYFGIFVWMIFWIIPLFCILPVIIRLRIVAEHFDEESFTTNKFTSRTTKGNLVTNFLLGSCMEYHFEHHVIPYIPHYNLKILSNELEMESNRNQNSQYDYNNYKNTGYIEYWIKLIKNKI